MNSTNSPIKRYLKLSDYFTVTKTMKQQNLLSQIITFLKNTSSKTFMQKIRGYITFDSTVEEVKKALEGFSEFNIKFISNENPGVLIDSEIEDNYYSKDITKKIENYLSSKTIGYDISIENEDTIKIIKDGEINKKYMGFRIHPPYNIENISEKVKHFDAENVLIRTVEEEENENKPKLSIELIGDFDEDQIIEKAKEMGGDEFFSYKIL